MHKSTEDSDPTLVPDTSELSASSELVFGLLHWLRIARYRRKTIIQAVFVAAVLGAIYYIVAPRYYQAAAKLLIIQRTADQMALMGEQKSLDNTMATHRELVTSPVVVQSALEQLLPEHRIDLRNTPPQRWSEKIASGLSASTTRKTNFIKVSYRSLSPEAAAAVVSSVVQSYLGFIEGTHKGTASDVLLGLTHELVQVERIAAIKQQELQLYRQQVGSLTVQKGDGIIDPTIQKAHQLSTALTEAQEDRFALERQLAAIEYAIRSGGDLQPYLAGMDETVAEQMMMSVLGLSTEDRTLLKDQQEKLIEAQTELKSLIPFYGSVHPKIAELNDRIRTIEKYLADYQANTGKRISSIDSQELGPLLASMLKQSVAQALEKEHQLKRSFLQAKKEAVLETGRIADLQKRERDIMRLERQQDVLVDRIANIDLRQLQAPIQATVVREPLPDDVPVSPQLRHVVFMSLFGGLCVGGLIVYVQDVLDDRFTSPEEIMGQLAVPVLAMVRNLQPIDGTGLAAVHTHVHPNAVETEAFRTLRTALTLSTDVAERILISSAEPGDGKTTVCVNLAVSFAQAGKKTLVIDADLRKPGMTAWFDLKGSAGVADLLQSDKSPAEIAPQLIHRTELDLLNVLPAGLRQPNPAELLSGSRFSDLLAWAESCYDQVLVDCPPVLAVSDAQVVGRLVDGAILVVRPDKNHRRLVVRACESFNATGSLVLGIVANVLFADSGSYGYDYGYGYGYGYGHEQDADDEIEETNSVSTGGQDDATSAEQAESQQHASWRRDSRAA